jgi:hypothetical protein
MPKRKPPSGRRFYTIEQANRALPLVKAIVGDIVPLYHSLMERRESLAKTGMDPVLALDDAHVDELDPAYAEFAKDWERLRELEQELRELDVSFKGGNGLVDFPCWMEGREVYLCWQLGEPEVSWWHEVDAGFLGRQPIGVAAGTGA